MSEETIRIASNILSAVKARLGSLGKAKIRVKLSETATKIKPTSAAEAPASARKKFAQLAILSPVNADLNIRLYFRDEAADLDQMLFAVFIHLRNVQLAALIETVQKQHAVQVVYFMIHHNRIDPLDAHVDLAPVLIPCGKHQPRW